VLTGGNFGDVVGAQLGPDGDALFYDELIGIARERLGEMHIEIETAFGEAGFYGGIEGVIPYPVPTTRADTPTPAKRPIVNAVRNLWIARWNPSDIRFFDGVEYVSDIETKFPWSHPEAAINDGWWLSTDRWPLGQNKLYANVGDLVVVQRQRPREPRPGEAVDLDNMYIGLAAIIAIAGAVDAQTGEYETQACLIPLCHFKHPVPIGVAKRTYHRLKTDAFSKLPAKRDGSGMNRNISALSGDDALELLSVCGVSPEILAEPDLPTIAGRLANTDTGNRAYLELRYDHQVRQDARHANEMRAEEAAKQWATDKGYLFVARDAWIKLAGYDLLFADGNGAALQVEVKGYSTDKLSDVHLQRSQVTRAEEAARGISPDWRLYVLLKASTKRPVEHVYRPDEVLRLVSRGELSVRD
jgi:hypothetical protein